MTPPGQSNKLPRDLCPVCGAEVALRRRGEFREHRIEGELCSGAGLTREQILERQEREFDALRRMGR